MTKGKENEEKNLLWYLREFRNGNKDIFNDLMYIHTYKYYNNKRKTKNKEDNYDLITMYLYRIEFLNECLAYFKNRYSPTLSHQDIESQFHEKLFKLFSSEKDYSGYTNQHLQASFRESFKNHFNDIVDKIKIQNQGYLEKTILNSDNPKLDFCYSDKEQFNKWESLDIPNNVMASFKENIDVKQYLTKKQAEVYDLMCQNEYMTQKEKQAELGRRETSKVDGIEQRVRKRLKEIAILYECFHNKRFKSPTEQIIELLLNIDHLKRYYNKFCPFTYLFNFLVEEKGKILINYWELQKNKPDYSVDILDILDNHMHSKTFSQLMNILNDEVFTPDKTKYIVNGVERDLYEKDKNKIADAIVNAFNDYLNETVKFYKEIN